MTHKLKINNLGYLASPFVSDAEITIEVSEEEYKKTRITKVDKIWKWDYDSKTFVLETTPYETALRFAREIICFSRLNKSPMWFNSLPADRQTSLNEWYNAWLDVTETKQIPKTPDWIENEL